MLKQEALFTEASGATLKSLLHSTVSGDLHDRKRRTQQFSAAIKGLYGGHGGTTAEPPVGFPDLMQLLQNVSMEQIQAAQEGTDPQMLEDAIAFGRWVRVPASNFGKARNRFKELANAEEKKREQQARRDALGLNKVKGPPPPPAAGQSKAGKSASAAAACSSLAKRPNEPNGSASKKRKPPAAAPHGDVSAEKAQTELFPSDPRLSNAVVITGGALERRGSNAGIGTAMSGFMRRASVVFFGQDTTTLLPHDEAAEERPPPAGAAPVAAARRNSFVEENGFTHMVRRGSVALMGMFRAPPVFSNRNRADDDETNEPTQAV